MKNNLLAYLIIIIIGLAALAVNLNKPFYGHHDFNSVYYSTMARNFLRYGLITTKLGQVTNSGLVEPEEFNFQTHYPSTFPLLLALSYRLFAFQEWAGRLVPLVFSLASLLLLYQIGRSLKFSWLASLSSLLIAFTPMFRYFAKLPVHEPLVVFVSLLSVYFYLRQRFSLFYLSAFLNGLLSWPGYLLYPVLTLHALVFNRRQWLKTALVNLVLGFSLLLHLIHIAFLNGVLFDPELFKALLVRLNLSDTAGFTWLKYLVQEARWLTVYYTYTFMAAAAIFIVCFRKTLAQTLITSLLVFPLSYCLVFSNMVFIHDYFNIFFLPFLALSLAWVVNWLQSIFPKLIIPLVILLALLVSRERLAFFQAQQNSNMHQTGYELGRLINQLVPEKQAAAVFSIDYANHHEVFINYYADRKIGYFGYGQDGLSKFNQQPVNYVFTVQTHKLDDSLVDLHFATQSAVISNFGQFNYYQLK